MSLTRAESCEPLLSSRTSAAAMKGTRGERRRSCSMGWDLPWVWDGSILYPFPAAASDKLDPLHPLKRAQPPLLISREHGSTAGLSTGTGFFEKMSSHQNPKFTL